MIDNTTNALAVGAMASPWWLIYLHAASDTAALLLPLLGVVWLVIQIIYKLAYPKEDLN